MNRKQRAALANPNLEFGASTFLGQPVGPNQMLIVYEKESEYGKSKVLYDFNAMSPENILGLGFEGQTGIKMVVLPSTDILARCIAEAPDAFEGFFATCDGIEKVMNIGSLPNIPTAFFAECTSLELELPDNVASVGNDAFANIDNLIYHGSLPGAPWGATKWNGVPQN